VSVQLQIITAIVKFFLRQPDAGQDMVMRALDTATQQSTNPDLRDRAFIYWRLLSSDPQAAAAVVLATRPPIQEDERVITSQALLDRLVGMLGSVASVLHKPPEMFMGSGRFGAVIKPPLSIQQEEAVVSKETVGDLLDLGFDDAVTTSPPTLTKQVSMDVFGATASPPTSSKSMAMDDMLGIFDTVSAPSSQKQPQGDLLDFL
jgi:vesicle coat complex subunit